STPGCAADLGGQLVSVQIRKTDIEQQGVRMEGLGKFEAAQAGVSGLNAVARQLQEHRASIRRVLVVIDDEDLEFRARRRGLRKRFTGLDVGGGRLRGQPHNELAALAWTLTARLYAA